jgi:Zn-dependent protease
MGESLAQNIQLLSVQFVPFVMAVVFHEYAHGFIASRWGDETAKERGRLTLNPLPHVDPLGTLVFPILMMLSGTHILFGWAKPVPIDPRRFRKFRPGLFWVSFAGPGMNFLLATLSAAAFCAIQRWMPQDFFFFEPLITMCYVSITLNYALGIFNLIPLPPLDGSKIIESVLPLELARKYESISRYGMLILMALLFTGALSVIGTPIRIASNLTLGLMARAFQLPEVTL